MMAEINTRKWFRDVIQIRDLKTFMGQEMDAFMGEHGSTWLQSYDELQVT